MALQMDLEISDFPPPETVHGLWHMVLSARVPHSYAVLARDLYNVANTPEIAPHVRELYHAECGA